MPADLENRQQPSEHFFHSDERVRLARELHHSMLEPLAALELELGLLKRRDPTRATALVDQCEKAIEEIKQQIAGLAAGDPGR